MMPARTNPFAMLLVGLIAVLLLSATRLLAQSTLADRNIGRSGPTALFEPLAEDAPSGNAGLFVGVNRFTADDGISQLDYAVNDAVETAYLFVFELKLIPATQCYVLISGDPSGDSVKRHLQQLRRAGANIAAARRSRVFLTFLRVRNLAKRKSDVLVCSFSSHGYSQRRDPYIMPSDGVRELLSDTAIALESIEDRMEDSQAGHRLLLVDACQERVSAKGDTATGQKTTQAFADALKQESGQAKLASCSPGEYSFEHGTLGGVGHGVFTFALLEALRGGARADDQNLVRLGAVADYVALRVPALTKQLKRGQQTPFLESPVQARRLPLAGKADDLTTLIASVRRQPLAGGLTASLRSQLLAALNDLDLTQEADRKLVASTRQFVNGRLAVDFFVPYVERALAPELEQQKQQARNRAEEIEIETVRNEAEQQRKLLETQAADPNIRKRFETFFAKARLQYDASARFGFLELKSRPQAASFGDLSGRGWLDNAENFAKAMSRQPNPDYNTFNDRPTRSKPQTAEEWDRLEEDLNLFKKLAPIWVQQKLLRP